MARPQEGSFAWPGRDRAAEIERAAALAAERGLERLRERQRRRRPPPPPVQPPLPPHAVPERPVAPPSPDPSPEDGTPDTDEPAAEDQSPAANGSRPTAPDPWGAEFDQLAEELIEDLRRDLGPGRI